MHAPSFDQRTTISNQDNFKLTDPSEEELKLQIQQLEGRLHHDEIRLKRLVIGAAYFTPFLVLALFATLFTWH